MSVTAEETIAPVVDAAVEAKVVPEVPAVDAVKTFSMEELKGLTDKKNLHMLIHGKVYAITKFMDEHPGGDEVLLGESGRDATEAFEDVGHSDEARSILDKYFVGNGPEGAVKEDIKKVRAAGVEKSGGNFNYLLPLAGLVAFIAYRYFESTKAAVV